MLAAAVGVALAAWLYGVAQQRQAQGGASPFRLIAAGLVLSGSVAMVTLGGYAPASAAAPAAGAAPSRPWSPQALSDLRAQGVPVLVNFTAAWCVTCQVNERVAFSAGEVAAALRRDGAVYLVADWTNRDAGIAKALTDQGRIGVPLYLLYGPYQAEPVVLPQFLTPGILVHALDAAVANR